MLSILSLHMINQLFSCCRTQMPRIHDFRRPPASAKPDLVGSNAVTHAVSPSRRAGTGCLRGSPNVN